MPARQCDRFGDSFNWNHFEEDRPHQLRKESQILELALRINMEARIRAR